uniref:RNA-binding protein n=2 Tax=Aquisalinus luteolus TaxID=1566827 RepID=A0A8J3A228_9PROT|nr:RNA-binding protein [Aquisalinus luteolus]
MLTDEQAAFWQRFCDATSHRGQPLDCDSFGGPDIADELLMLVLSGRKRATCSNACWVKKGFMPMPRRGGLAIVTDAANNPACVIRTEKVTIKPFRDVTVAFAWREGEGSRMLSDWKRGHRHFFHREALENGFAFRETDLCIFEEFTMIWQP